MQDVVLKSRVRLARNCRDLPFPNRMTPAQMETLIDRVNAAINPNKELLMLSMRDLPAVQRQMLVERHLISPELAQNKYAAALVNKEETVSILIGEEDHLRIQCLLPGLALNEADRTSLSIDRLLSERLPYAFDKTLGYLTACPTNLGTGMRASVMLHLPALALTGQINALIQNAVKLGYTVRGIYGEGSTSPGHIYQISNQVTLGILEEDILSNLSATIEHIVERERAVRQSLRESNAAELEDLVFRSYGICAHARILNTNECMEHLSNLKLGASLGYLELDQQMLNHAMTDIQPASLMQKNGQALEQKERDILRAQTVRRMLCPEQTR